MPIDQKYNGTRKRSTKIGYTKLDQTADKSVKRQRTAESPLVTWIKRDWPTIAGLLIIFFIALFLRAYFYYPVATKGDFLLSGNDPFYHKRVIDYAQNYFTHLSSDPLLDYPLIGRNPRPPAYDWSNVAAGMFLSPFFNGDIETATWYIFLFSPAFWGALTIFPVYFLTRDMFGRKPAFISAFFMAVMASHIERSPLGFSDHDAMVVFFVVTSLFFLAKSIGHLKNQYWVKSWRNPLDITIGIRNFFQQNIVAVAFSIMCGLSMGAVGLIWKGFPYVFVILLGSFLILSVINQVRKVDSLGIFLCFYIAFITGLIISLPWYAYFNIGTWAQPLYMLLAFIVVGIAMVPTRDLPWILVIPTFIITIGIAMTVLSYYQPEMVDNLFTGGGYFIKSKLYSTIAEAQAPDTSRLAISYGPVTFYLALIGLLLAAIQIPKHWKLDFFVIIVWCALAIYMAMSAVRFMFNATPVFAILSGWVSWNIIERMDPTLREFKKIETKFVYFYIGILAFIIMMAGYWYLYLEQGNYLYFQAISGIGLFGIFIAIFAAWIMFKYNYWIGILIYVSFIVFWLWYTLDVLINQTFGGNNIIWEKLPWEQFYFATAILIMIFIPMIIYILSRHSMSGSKLDLKHVAIALFFTFLVFMPNLMFAVDASIPYETKSEYDPDGEMFGAFGHSFPAEYWQAGFDWLSEQDNEMLIEDRPGFISWWDYGFWCLYLGDHPTVADNFQAGYQLAGSFIASTDETAAISLFAVRILEGDFKNGVSNKFSPEVAEIIIDHFDEGDSENHPTYDKIVKLFKIETASASEQEELIDEIESNPEKYNHFTDLKIKNAKYAAVRQVLESHGMERVVDFLHDLEIETDNSIRYFAVDTRLFPFTASNTGIYYAPLKLADKDINDYLKYLAYVDVRDTLDDEWRAYSEIPIPTEELEDEIDLYDLVDTHGPNNVRITDYQLQYTDDFYNCMFYKCYIGYTYSDIFPDGENEEAQCVPGIYGRFSNPETTPAMQGWNMTHFRLVYRTAYWTPYNQTELQRIPDKDKKWEAMGELEALNKIREIRSDGKDNNNNGEIDDDGEGGTWSPGYRGGGVYFLKYYDGAVIQGKVVTDSESKTPLNGIRMTVMDEFGIPHDSTYTDEEGNYKLIAPFGQVVVAASKDGYPVSEDEALNYRLRLTEQTMLNNSYYVISDEQAMRKTSNWIINSDMPIPVGTVKGKLYWELSDDSLFNEVDDEVITSGTLYLNGTNKKYNLSYTIEDFEEDGSYKFNDVVPGKYTLSADLNGHRIEYPDEIEILRNEQTGVIDDFEQDFAVRPASIWGNVSLTNDTEYLPENITVNLKDLTNNSIMKFDLAGDDVYFYTDLLTGEYLLIVDEPGLQYFEQNMILGEGFNQTLDIQLIPLVQVTGNVYYDKFDDGFDAIDALPNARIEFLNNDNMSLSVIVTTDETGSFDKNIPKGNYSIYVYYTDNANEFVHISSKLIQENTLLNLTLALESGFWLNGSITKQVNTPVEHATIRFIFPTIKDDPNSPNATYSVPTNSIGWYSVFLPYREYQIEIEHITTPGNVTYIYFNKTSYLKDDVETIIENPGNDNINTPARNVGPNDKLEITNDIHIFEASLIEGYLYWDHNRDGIYYISNETDNNSQPQQTRTRQATEGDQDIPSDIETIGSTIRFFPYDLSGPEYELIPNTRLVFDHEKGLLETYTNDDGYYGLYLPPGNTTISTNDPRFQPLETTNSIESLSIFMPDNESTEITRDLLVWPKNTTVTGQTGFDWNGSGIFNSDNTVGEIPINFILINPLMNNSDITNLTQTVTSNPDSGEYTIDLLPGEYSVAVDHNVNPIVKYTYSNIFLTPFKYSTEDVDNNILLRKFIFANISLQTEDAKLNSSNIKNVTLEMYFEDGAQLNPLPINLNGTFYQGYVAPLNYTIKAKYVDISASSEGENVNYIYFGSLNFSDTNNQYNLIMRKATEMRLTAFIDADASGDFTNAEAGTSSVDEVHVNNLNLTLISSTGGVDYLHLANGSLTQLLMPGIKYTILVNDTQELQAAHGIKIVRYTSEFNFEIPINTTEIEIETPLVKLLKFTGKIFYDENNNDVGDQNEVDPDVPIHFTGPMNFSVISNASGRFSKFVLPGTYNVIIEKKGFLEKPSQDSFEVTDEDRFFDIFEVPKKIVLHGITYFDADLDTILYPETLTESSNNKNGDRVLGGVTIEFVKNVQPEELTENQEMIDWLKENTHRVISDATTGKYSIDLDPGEYNIYSYKSYSNNMLSYSNLDLRILELSEEFEYNLSLYKGRSVNSKVFYRDSNLKPIENIHSSETGNVIRFESLDTAGARLVSYRDGFVDMLYLAYGNYSVTTEFLTEEYDIDMEYSLSETVWVQPEDEIFTFELNKENDFTFSFNVISDQEVEVRTADRHTDVFKLKLVNEGNSHNVIDLDLQDVPEGWYVHLSNKTVPLDLSGEFSELEISVDITIPVTAYARNEFKIIAAPRGDPAKTNTVSLTVKTPALYEFEIDYQDDLDLGIKFNDTIQVPINIFNTGNADDELYIKFTQPIPMTWNVSLAEVWDPNDNDIIYQEDTNTFIQQLNQEMIQQNVTIEITSPDEFSGIKGESIEFLCGISSKNKPHFEYFINLTITIRDPDLIVKDIKVQNADLKQGANVTIKATVENDFCYVENSSYSLLINNVLVQNKSVGRIEEDSDTTIEFYWDVSDYNLSITEGRDYKFKIEANGNRSISEIDFNNNQESVLQFIGGKAPVKEYNWRPLLAMLTVLIVLIVIYVIYRWRRRV